MQSIAALGFLSLLVFGSQYLIGFLSLLVFGSQYLKYRLRSGMGL